MSKSFRFGTTASMLVLGTMLAGCAAPQGHTVSASGFGGQANGEVGLATRALAALNANDFATAISLAERAVEKTPDDAGFRALLGNAYFGSGRFASAEAAYKDALSIYGNQPQVVLKLALVQIAQGKSAEAGALLDNARGVLDPADLGLALALAGRASEAVSVLEPAARNVAADGRVRQNLALAYGFAGDWTNARVIAAQDVSADQLDARLQQWMQMSNPAQPSDQLAALTGIRPVASDPGQPVRLALHRPETRTAQAEAPAQPPAAASAQMVQAQAAEFVPPPPPPPPVAMEEPAPAPVPAAEAAPAPDAPAFAGIEPKVEAAKPAPQEYRRASVSVKLPKARKVAARSGKSNAVVQIGAYGSPDRVLAAWNAAAHRHGSLKSYTPMSARFQSPRGTVYRLAVKGFANTGEANALCASLKRSGGSCFVRNIAGDRPVQFASR